jgi:hypothetical protein
MKKIIEQELIIVTNQFELLHKSLISKHSDTDGLSFVKLYELEYEYLRGKRDVLLYLLSTISQKLTP